MSAPPRSPIWYSTGLSFQCTGCGNCCTGEPGYVWVTDAEIDLLAGHLQLERDVFLRKYVRLAGDRLSLIEMANGDCVFFDNQARCCTVYEARPLQCRTWPFWDSNLRSRRAWREIARGCPGCGQGPVIPLEEIEHQRRIVSV